MVQHTFVLGSLAALALAASAAQAQTFTGDGTSYTLGSVSSGNCNFMAAAASAATNYAAINQAQWDSLKNCGRCAQVSCVDAACADKTVSEVVHIVDRCPECKSGDLDLSPSVFKKITGSSPSRLKIQWKFVDCPSEGNLKYCLKSGSNPYFVAIQPANAGAGVASMKINGQATTMVASAFYYVLSSQSPVDLSAVKVSLTSSSGTTVDETVSLSVGACTAGKSQFGGGSAVTPPATTPTATSNPGPAATPKASSKPSPAASPKPATTRKPTRTPRVAPASSAVGADSTPAPAPSSASSASTPAPASASSSSTTPAPATASGDDEYATPAPDSVVTPAPAPGSASGSTAPAPASASTGGSTTSAPAPASASDDDEYATPAPATGGATTASPSATPAVTPKKTSKPAKCTTKAERQRKKNQQQKEKKTATSAPAPAAAY